MCLYTLRYISLHLLWDGGRRGSVRVSWCQDTGGTIQWADRTNLCAATWDRRCQLVPWPAGAWALWDPRPQTKVSFVCASRKYTFPTQRAKHPIRIVNSHILGKLQVILLSHRKDPDLKQMQGYICVQICYSYSPAEVHYWSCVWGFSQDIYLCLQYRLRPVQSSR